MKIAVIDTARIGFAQARATAVGLTTSDTAQGRLARRTAP
jgi:hypothetical protein